MHQIYFSWGFAPDPTGGAHSTPQAPSLDLRGLLLREEVWGGKAREGKGKGRVAEGKGGEETGRGGG